MVLLTSVHLSTVMLSGNELFEINLYLVIWWLHDGGIFLISCMVHGFAVFLFSALL